MVLVTLAVVLFLAFLVETGVEYIFAPIYDNFPKIKPHKWTQMYIALAIGIVGAFVYHLDLVNLLSQFLSQVTPETTAIPVSTFGLIITGAAIGRGANYIHDIYTKFFVKTSVIPE